MRNIITFFVLLAVLCGSTQVLARGSGADDCPAGSTDPDCVSSSKNGK